MNNPTCTLAEVNSAIAQIVAPEGVAVYAKADGLLPDGNVGAVRMFISANGTERMRIVYTPITAASQYSFSRRTLAQELQHVANLTAGEFAR